MKASYQSIEEPSNGVMDNLNGFDDYNDEGSSSIRQQQRRKHASVIGVPQEKQLSALDAGIHLVKGNLGPGCLNLPHAFVLVGWPMGCVLFLFIALQGIYSMWLLLYCKNLLVIQQQQQKQQQSKTHHQHSNGNTTTINNDNNNSTDTRPIIMTFMDVAEVALGWPGKRLVEVFLFVLQGGVCCVFLALISTNLAAATNNTPTTCVILVTIVLLFIVLLRFIKDLLWLSTTANGLMIMAIFTATIAGVINYYYIIDNDEQGGHFQHSPTTSTTDIANPTSLSSIMLFSSDMFFSFEGIGLVLPIENSFRTTTSTTKEGTTATTSYPTVMIRSMTIVASLFLLIGVSASIGFPSIQSGSVTAYLQEEYPYISWFSICNASVMIAVALTFPLQLTPAMQVLDSWLDDNNDDYDKQQQQQQVEPIEEQLIALNNINNNDAHHISNRTITTTGRQRHHNYDWIIRRWAMVLLCALIVLLVNDLSLLISLIGAIGQTGLAAMPCAIHLALQRQQQQGIVPSTTTTRWSLSYLQVVLDITILLFCGTVMIAGCTFSIKDIVTGRTS